MGLQEDLEKITREYEQLKKQVSIQKQTRIANLNAEIAGLKEENIKLKIAIAQMKTHKHNERNAGRPKSVNNAEDIKEMCRLRLKGKTVKALAEQFNCSISTANRILKSNMEVSKDMDNKEYGKLSFNYDNKRYGILNNMDLWENDGLHCGEPLDVLINDELVHTRIEMKSNKTWYLVGTKLEGDQLEGLKIVIS